MQQINIKERLVKFVINKNVYQKMNRRMKNTTITLVILMLLFVACNHKKNVKPTIEEKVELISKQDSLDFYDILQSKIADYWVDSGVSVDIDLPNFSFKLKKDLTVLEQIILGRIEILEQIYGGKPKSKLNVKDIYKKLKKDFDDFYYKDFLKDSIEYYQKYNEDYMDYDAWLHYERKFYHINGNPLYHNNNVLVYNIVETYSGYHVFHSTQTFMIDLNTLTIIDEQQLFDKKDFDKISDLLKEQGELQYLLGWGEEGIMPNGNCYLDYDMTSNNWYMVWQYQEYEIACYAAGMPKIAIELSKLQPYLKIDVTPYISLDGLVKNKFSIDLPCEYYNPNFFKNTASER